MRSGWEAIDVGLFAVGLEIVGGELHFLLGCIHHRPDLLTQLQELTAFPALNSLVELLLVMQCFVWLEGEFWSTLSLNIRIGLTGGKIHCLGGMWYPPYLRETLRPDMYLISLWVDLAFSDGRSQSIDHFFRHETDLLTAREILFLLILTDNALLPLLFLLMMLCDQLPFMLVPDQSKFNFWWVDKLFQYRFLHHSFLNFFLLLWGQDLPRLNLTPVHHVVESILYIKLAFYSAIGCVGGLGSSTL